MPSRPTKTASPTSLNVPPQAFGRTIAVGFRKWKAVNIRPLLGLHTERVHFVATAGLAQALNPSPADRLIWWGAQPPSSLRELAAHSGATLVRMEDGFYRSVGLGSDLIRPWSLVMDTRGIYFDPSAPSDLEHLLNTADFTPQELMQAQAIRQFIVERSLSKYNIEASAPVRWPHAGRRVILVPGQVEDDASIRLGCTQVRTNLSLLQAARARNPGAFIVYKPHPDVSSGNRRGSVSRAQVHAWADHIELDASLISCLDACDEVHTMTSQAGFDALLRGKKVVTYGQPFYAGWGLTQDEAEGGVALARRKRLRTLDELVAAALLRYPVYWDWRLHGFTDCEAVLRHLANERDDLTQQGRLSQLRDGFIRRQLRKLRTLVRAALQST